MRVRSRQTACSKTSFCETGIPVTKKATYVRKRRKSERETRTSLFGPVGCRLATDSSVLRHSKARANANVITRTQSYAREVRFLTTQTFTLGDRRCEQVAIAVRNRSTILNLKLLSRLMRL